MRTINNICKKTIWSFLIALLLVSCQGGKTVSGEDGDTLQMKYAQLLTIVNHDEGAYTEAVIHNPWKKGTELHRYMLVPKGKVGDETATKLKKENIGKSQMGSPYDIIRTPLEKSIVFTAPHCQLMYELGKQNAITGVCDKEYINIPAIKNKTDCGSSMQPDIEKIITLKPEGLLISPFENSGGYGKLDKLHIPIIETADYMETSPLGRAEWIKLYGLLFGSEQQSDSLFSNIEKDYLNLKAEAAKLPLGLSILTERKTGSVWYVPGGKSTMGILLKDANAKYIFSKDTHSGSLSLSPEQILAKGNLVDVWAFKYFGGKALGRDELLAEYQGYKSLKALNTNSIFEVDTNIQPYFEQTSFHPEILLREFIILAHPKATQFGKLRFYQPYKE